MSWCLAINFQTTKILLESFFENLFDFGFWCLQRRVVQFECWYRGNCAIYYTFCWAEIFFFMWNIWENICMKYAKLYAILLFSMQISKYCNLRIETLIISICPYGGSILLFLVVLFDFGTLKAAFHKLILNFSIETFKILWWKYIKLQ